MMTSARDDWQTPAWLFDLVHSVFDFTIDGAASKENAQLLRFWDTETDGLKQDWTGERVWINPPYGLTQRVWITKAHEEWEKKRAESVMLIPVRPGARIWQNVIFPSGVPVLFLAGRLKFLSDGKLVGSATFDSALVFFLRESIGKLERERESFEKLGAFCSCRGKLQ